MIECETASQKGYLQKVVEFRFFQTRGARS